MEIKRQRIELILKNRKKLYGLSWTQDESLKGNIIIVTGMEETASRYNDFAIFLCKNHFNVYCVDAFGQGENVDLDKSKSKLIGSAKRFFEGCNDILDVWLFESNVSLNNIKLQKEEVCDCMWASSEKIKELYNKGEFDANPYFDEIVGEKNV